MKFRRCRKNTHRKKQEIEEDKKQAEQELKVLLLKSGVPTLAELEASRDIRNAGWHLIKRKYIEQIDIEKELSEYTPDSDLPTAYEKNIEQADHNIGSPAIGCGTRS